MKSLFSLLLQITEIINCHKVVADLADELADCERREFNLIIQNLSENEATTMDAGKQAFSAIFNFMGLNISVKHLGKKVDGRTWPY